MNNWLTRFLSLFLIVVFIWIYQLTTLTRVAEAEERRLLAELAEARSAREALEEALEKVKETLREQTEMDSKTGEASSETEYVTSKVEDEHSKTGAAASETGEASLSEKGTAGSASAETGSALYASGSYEGSGQGFGGEVAVRVTVTEREIADVEILAHAGEDATYFSYASQLIQDILEEQTWDVDVVSGATFSSNGIKAAVRAALEEASGHA